MIPARHGGGMNFEALKRTTHSTMNSLSMMQQLYGSKQLSNDATTVAACSSKHNEVKEPKGLVVGGAGKSNCKDKM